MGVGQKVNYLTLPPKKKTVSETIDIKEQRRPDEAGFVINGNRTKKGESLREA